MDIIQFILPTLVIQAGAGYYISERTSQWRDAVGQCNMATPDLHPTQDGFKVQIDYDLNNGDVWLGYFMKMTVFDYIGCVKLYNHNYIQVGQINSPGLCYTFCKGNEMIGVSIGKCICIDTLGNYSKHEINCTTSCGSSREGIACGGDGYMSVYKVNKNVGPDSRKTPCLSFIQYDTQIFRWLSCAEYVLVMCENELTVPENRPWLDSMNKCFKMNLLPISYQALTEIRSRKSPFWSGVISSDVIYNYTEWSKNFKDVQFGYLSANNSVYFTDTDEPRFVLCSGTSTEEDATLANPTTNTPWKIESTTKRDVDPERENSTTILVTKNANALQLPHTNTKGQTVSVIIGVSVCVCVVIIAVVAIIVLKRRGKLPTLPCFSGQDVVMKDKVDKSSTGIGDRALETGNSEQDHYTALSHTEYVNGAHTYDWLQQRNSDRNACTHERNISIENGNIYYNDIISKRN